MTLLHEERAAPQQDGPVPSHIEGTPNATGIATYRFDTIVPRNPRSSRRIDLGDVRLIAGVAGLAVAQVLQVASLVGGGFGG